MSSSTNVSNALGGKNARACDGCVKKRARWYCAADDAFLCQACDQSVHSANSLARRHERVRLKTSSTLKLSLDKLSLGWPSWHKGFTRKARTPRHGKSAKNLKSRKSKELSLNPFHLVPEVGGDETSHEENDEQLLYRVPIFDPSFGSELCSTSGNSNEGGETVASEVEITKIVSNGEESKGESLQGFLPSETDLAEFAADVESLLGRGLDENECFGIEGLGFVDCEEKETKVKVEEGEEGTMEGSSSVVKACWAESEIDLMREPFEFNFEDYDSPASCGEDEKAEVGAAAMKNGGGNEEEKKGKKKKRKILLSLDYDAVISAWDGQVSPWTTGNRPDFDADDCLGTCGGEVHHHYMSLGGVGGHPAMADGEREARVSRYREKRRTRLFSKKIRYEVRKLNAEKRPRMKGRFVKRASFATPACPLLTK
ncbi:hypothetical protein UlMin_040574 [Ulmus minor]